jgi:hypothetical protein
VTGRDRGRFAAVAATGSAWCGWAAPGGKRHEVWGERTLAFAIQAFPSGRAPCSKLERPLRQDRTHASAQ